MLKKVMKIMKDERGQGVWEYMVALIGIAIVAYAVTSSLNTGLTADDGVVDTVTGKVGDIITDTTTLDGSTP